jgi:methionyl-tRNA formyltransferase
MVEPLRIVTFNVFPPAYQLIATWAARRGHRLVLLVTSPSPRGERYGAGHRDLVESVPADQDVLITTRLRRTAAPVIRTMAPDLIVSATFPHRIPPEVTAIPRYGAVNLHPAPLPRGRGPNPQRLIYEGDTIVAGTLHRIAPDFDAGAVLSLQERSLPDDLTPGAILGAWSELLAAALDEGAARAAAGEPGDEQDERLATYAAPFTEEERWLTWNEPARTVQRRVAALNLSGPTARARIGGQEVLVLDVRARPAASSPARPGSILDRSGDTVTVQVADGAIAITVRPWPSSAIEGGVFAPEIVAASSVVNGAGADARRLRSEEGR